MRISDWSSDVCSSDLIGRLLLGRPLDEQCRDRAVGQPRIHRERHVRGDHIFLERGGNDVRHRLPAEFLRRRKRAPRSEEHTSELQSLMRISYAVFCLKKKKYNYLNAANRRERQYIQLIRKLP